MSNRNTPTPDAQIVELRKRIRSKVVKLDSRANGSYEFGTEDFTSIPTPAGNIGKHMVVYDNESCSVTISYLNEPYLSPWEQFNHITHSTILKGKMRHHFQDGTVKETGSHESFTIPCRMKYRWEVLEPVELLTVFEPPL